MSVGAGYWVKEEHDFKKAIEFRRAMGDLDIGYRDAEITFKMDALTRGYEITERANHTRSYALMGGALLVLIIGIGMRASSKKQNAETTSN